MKIARAPWTSGSFLLYAGGLLTLGGALAWMAVISSEHGEGAFAGWTVLFWAVAVFLALWFLLQGRRITAGIFAVVAWGTFAVMVGAFFSWWGWLDLGGSPFGGFHVGKLFFELIILVAGAIYLRIWRFPLIVLPVAFMTWFFLTDLVSGGGNWTNVVTLLIGFAFFLAALGLDGSDARWYGFWLHVLAGVLIGGVFLDWWNGSDAGWAGIIVIGLLFILIGAGIRRSSYAVLGAAGLILATGHYVGSSPSLSVDAVTGSGGGQASWAAPVGFLCLGLFLALLGTMLYGTRDDELDDA